MCDVTSKFLSGIINIVNIVNNSSIINNSLILLYIISYSFLALSNILFLVFCS